jgi:hypothetical protein
MKGQVDSVQARAVLSELLDAWQEGTKDEGAVLKAAEALEGSWELWASDAVVDAAAIDSDRSDGRSVLSALINMLSVLHHDGWAREDVPAMQAFLEASETDPISAWAMWDAYAAGIDWEQRKQDLREQLLYSPFVALGRGPWNA